MNNFLNGPKILTPFQQGFRKGLSTVTQLSTVIHSFAFVLDRGGQMDVIFPDFQKAFDVVPHDKLICKLNHLGFPSFILPWITAYLMHCEQHVVIDGQQFDSSSVTSGDPQGSVLGPLLILIYCNDIVDDIQSPINIRFFCRQLRYF